MSADTGAGELLCRRCRTAPGLNEIQRVARLNHSVLPGDYRPAAARSRFNFNNRRRISSSGISGV